MGHPLDTSPLAPGFLLAPPPLADPNFSRALVLLATHDSAGSMGFILNRKSSMSLHELLDDLKIVPRVPDQRVLIGGPVNGYAGFVLYEHEVDQPLGPGMLISPTVSISPARDVLERGALGGLPGRFELLLGYAGWGEQQLGDELNQGTWLHAPFDHELAFEVPLDERWEGAYQRLGLAPFSVVTVPGGAQA